MISFNKTIVCVMTNNNRLNAYSSLSLWYYLVFKRKPEKDVDINIFTVSEDELIHSGCVEFAHENKRLNKLNRQTSEYDIKFAYDSLDAIYKLLYRI
jgi:hypothetical protein